MHDLGQGDARYDKGGTMREVELVRVKESQGEEGPYKQVLAGAKGAVQFAAYLSGPVIGDMGPMAVDLGYHAIEPVYRGQVSLEENCQYLRHKPCYYDGSTLAAGPVLRLLQETGEEAVWVFLADYYHRVFYPDSE